MMNKLFSHRESRIKNTRDRPGTIRSPGTAVIFLLMCILLLYPRGTPAAEMPDPSMNGKSSISVAMRDKNTDEPIPGGKLELIRIASVESDNGFVFVPLTGLTDFTFDLSAEADLSDPSLAADVNTYVENHLSEVQPIETDIGVSGTETGKASFTGLDLGLYLIRQTQAAEGYAKIEPFLVTIPRKTEEGYVYQVDATPKIAKVSKLAPVTVICPKIRKTVEAAESTEGSSTEDPPESTAEDSGKDSEIKIPKDGKFEFLFERLDSVSPKVSNQSGAVSQGGSIQSQDENSIVLVLIGPGELEIGRITFENAGDYYYQLSEKKGGDPHYTYDETKYWIHYEVGINAAEDGLEIRKTEVRLGGPTGQAVSEREILPFKNEYIPDPEPSPVVSPSPSPGGGGTSGGSTYSSSGGGSLPQTGQLWWPMWLLGGLGAVLAIACAAGFRRYRKSIRRLLITVSTLCLAAAAGWGIYNVWDSYRAGEASARIEADLIDRIQENMRENTRDPSKDPGSTGNPGKEEGLLQTIPLENPEATPYKDMPVEEMDGYQYIGFLEIPSIGLSLPVMENWDYTRLKVSPCRYSGSYYTDDLVICAHNYYRHFTPVKDNLGMGRDVYFTNVQGESIHYLTVNKETIQPTDVERMVSDSLSNDQTDPWDLTLFTCNAGGQTRVAIRCKKM